ncbi:MAG: hypothetical protein J7641_09925 [Cyanobacteria bacterium SID2]|nr:hypothetical protein [Cyanobacteria bacterium SID2]MBP0002123.1 hypothetical protein [Cyanobacteria bacterium SBC]
MKSFVRRVATFGSIVGLLFGASATAPAALALSEEEILDKLESIPVFTVTDAEGAPLIATITNAGNSGETTEVAGVFIDAEDARRFVERLKSQQPDIGDDVQVTVISLAEIYRLDRENTNNNTPIEFSYIPTQEDVEAAVSVFIENERQSELRQVQDANGETQYQFPGVPLFLATAGPNQGYMTLEYNGEVVIPAFFDREDLNNVLERFRQQQPEVADSVQIEVVQLEGTIEALENEDNPVLQQLMLVPDSDSLEFVQNLVDDIESPSGDAEIPEIELPTGNE